MKNFLAANTTPFGEIKEPDALSKFGTDPGVAIGKLIQTIIWVLIVGAGLYALFNFVIAGYSFLSAGDDPKKVAGAWAMIWQSALGLAVSAGALILAAMFGQLIFGDATAILYPTLKPIQ